MLSLEEFCEVNDCGQMRLTNFQGYFLGGSIGRMYRATPQSIRFQEEHPELDRELCELVKEAHDLHLRSDVKTLTPIAKDLYEAFLIMRTYVENEEDLLL